MKRGIVSFCVRTGQSNQNNQLIVKKMKIIKGKTRGHGRKISVVVSKFNEFITQRLQTKVSNKTTTMGIIHHIFSRQRKANRAPAMPNLSPISRISCILSPVLPASCVTPEWRRLQLRSYPIQSCR